MSKTENTPIKKIRIEKRLKTNSFLNSVMAFQLINKHIGINKTLKVIKNTLTPSTAISTSPQFNKEALDNH